MLQSANISPSFRLNHRRQPSTSACSKDLAQTLALKECRSAEYTRPCYQSRSTMGLQPALPRIEEAHIRPHSVKVPHDFRCGRGYTKGIQSAFPTTHANGSRYSGRIPNRRGPSKSYRSSSEDLLSPAFIYTAYNLDNNRSEVG